MKKFGEDLEIEILLRLPPKSLMRFKCVQRSWNTLIKTPYFVNRKTKLSVPPNRTSLLIIDNLELKLLPCGRDNNDKPISVKSLFRNNLRPIESNKLIQIESYGSCNGVFCLKGIYRDTKTRGNFNHLILWNPTTNELHRIPRVRSDGNTFSYGFASVGGDFKVVKLTICPKKEIKQLSPLAQIYSLNTKSWTVIHNCCPPIKVTFQKPTSYHSHYRYKPSRYNSVLVNGVYYWIGFSDLFLFPMADILCFNFCNNQFQQLKAPRSFEPRNTYCDDIIKIKGSLGYVMLSNNFDKVCVEIWVMFQNSWSKKYHINFNMPMDSLRCIEDDAAEILGGKAGELLKSYDHSENELRQFPIKIPERGYFRVYEYVPSITLLSK